MKRKRKIIFNPLTGKFDYIEVGFPVPDYDSGWVALNRGESKTLTHSLGDNADNYFVDAVAKHPAGVGINNKFIGTEVDRNAERGFYWTGLDTTYIIIRRAADDFNAEYVRIRIWKY